MCHSFIPALNVRHSHRKWHLFFCVGVAPQSRHQTASWRWRLHAAVLSFSSTVFPRVCRRILCQQQLKPGGP